MQPLGIKKFLFDYLIAGGLMFLLLVLLMKNTTVWHEQATVVLSQSCSLPFPKEDALQSLLASLKKGEHCEVISPCLVGHSIRCEVSVRVLNLTDGSLNGDTLVTRMMISPIKSFGISSYEVVTEDKVPIGLIILMLGYGLVLTEAGAALFALWRQKKLKQTLTFPVGSKPDYIYKPALFAALLSVIVILLNHLFFYGFDHPEVDVLGTTSVMLQTSSGILIAVILAPLAEELLFRGVLLRFFIEKKKLLLGTLVISLIFSILHGFREPSFGWQLYVSSIYFVLSIFLCGLYIKHKNLWSPIVFHSAYNSTIVIAYQLLV